MAYIGVKVILIIMELSSNLMLKMLIITEADDIFYLFSLYFFRENKVDMLFSMKNDEKKKTIIIC